MAATKHRTPMLLRVVGVSLGVGLAALVTAAPAVAINAPQLSIVVDNGHSSAATGDTLTYAITVRNLGTTGVAGLQVTQSMPAGLAFESADSAGAAQAGSVSWRLDLKAAGEATVHSTMTVSDPPAELQRLASVACAGTSAAGPPVVCASHSDQLPVAAGTSSAGLLWYVAAGIGVVVAGLAVALIVRRGAKRRVATTSIAAVLLVGIMVGGGSSTAPTDVRSPAFRVEQSPLFMGSVTAQDGANGAGAPVEPAVELLPAEFTTALPGERAGIAVAAAMAQIGLPYVWGGNGPSAGDAGFDCSGLTTFAYAAAGVALPRTAHTQYYAGPHVPAGASLQPGDLVFYGTPANVHHVGMYIGLGRMVNAPTFGKPVQTAYYRWAGDDYLGATRPAAVGVPSIGLLPSAPPPTVRRTSPPTFLAPAAPVPSVPLPAPTEPQPSEADTAAAAIAAGGLPGTTPDPQPGQPVTTTPSQPAPPASIGPSASPATVPAAEVGTTLTMAGGTSTLSAATRGADGLPGAVGLWNRAGRPVVRLASAAVLDGTIAGSPITLSRTAVVSSRYTVVVITTVSTQPAAAIIAGAPSGVLVVLAPAGRNRWIVLEARA